MQNQSSKKTLSVSIMQNSSQRKVHFKKPTYTSLGNSRAYPGELTSAQWRNFKIKPSNEVVTDFEKNLGKLMTYPALRESFAQLVEHKKPYQHQIKKDGITGTSEIVAYHFTKDFLDRKVDLAHLEIIQNLILVIVKKQLRATPYPNNQFYKAAFVNESMIPRMKCTTLDGSSKTKLSDVLYAINELMLQSVLLNLEISIKRFDDTSDDFKIVIWTKSVFQKAVGIHDASGLWCSKYPKITCDEISLI